MGSTGTVTSPPTESRPRRLLGALLAPLRTRLFGEGLWVLLGQAGTASAAIIGVRLLTEYADPKVFGEVNLWLGLLILGRDLCCTPLVRSALRFYSEVSGTGELPLLRRLVSRLLCWNAGALAAACLVAGAVSSAARGTSLILPLALAGLLVVEVVKNLECAFLQAARRQRAQALWTGGEAWARPLMAIAAILLLGLTPQAVLIGYLAGSGGLLLVFLRALRREGLEPASPASDAGRRMTRAVWHFAWPLSVLAVVNWFNTLSDRYIIGWLMDADQVGLYVAAVAPVAAPFLMAQGVISGTLGPMYYAAVSDHDRRLEAKILRFWVAATIGVGALGVLLVALLKHWIAYLALAERFRGGASLMPWIAGGYACFALAQVLSDRLFAHKRNDLIVVVHLVGAVASVVLATVLVSFFGLHGAAYACTSSFFVVALTAAAVSQYAVARYRRLHSP